MQWLFQLRANGKRILLGVIFFGLIAAGYTALNKTGGLESLIVHEQRLRSWIETRPITAFVLGLAVYTTASFIPGTTGKAIAVGWLYGFWMGIVLVETALSITALAAFLFSRHLLRDVIRTRYALFLDRVDKNLLSHPVLYVLTLRLAHVPYTILNYTLGATAISLRTFLWTTALGLLPGTIVFVFAGVRLPTLAELAEQGAWGLLDPWLLTALGLSAAAVPLSHLVLRWWRGRWTGAARSLQEFDN